MVKESKLRNSINCYSVNKSPHDDVDAHRIQYGEHDGSVFIGHQ